MIDFEANPADRRESRLEGEWTQTGVSKDKKCSARILTENLPAWLEEEIRAECLSICGWGDPGSEAVDCLQTHFPESRVTAADRITPLAGTYDVIVASNVLQEFVAPWDVLRTLGSQAARHLLVLVPSDRESRSWQDLYCFDVATIGTHIDPDFQLSACEVIEPGSYLLLAYSRAAHYPHSRAVFYRKVSAPPREPTQVEQVDEAGVRDTAAREAALSADIRALQAKVAALERQLRSQTETEAELRASAELLRAAATRLGEAEKNCAAENQALTARAVAGAQEASALRRLLSDLHRSLSWKITAPLRFLTKPLFAALAPRTGPQPAPREATPIIADVHLPTPATKPEPRGPSPIETVILPQLRSARTIAVVSCAIPFSSTLNQRPISFAKCLADSGTTVLFVEVWQSPEQAIHNTGEEVYPGIFSIPFYAFSSDILYTFRDNLEAIASASQVNKLYLCTIPMAGLVDVTGPLRAAGYHIHYDVMDDWEEFNRGDQQMAHWFSAAVEQEMLILSDTVSTVSDMLARKFDHLRSDIVVVRNGYQPSALGCGEFLSARAPLTHPKTVGYFGHFADAWFDWETVFYAARERPELHFELIGSGLSERSSERLKSFRNIRFLGLIPQRDLHRYAGKWWAGMIPFSPSALSAAVDPLKIYEYLHFGLPTIVTGISGIADYPLVHYVRDPRAFVSVLDQIPDRPNDQTLSQVSEFLKECVWEERMAKLNRMVNQSAALPFLYAH